jgi:nitrate/nitrite transporter NarK
LETTLAREAAAVEPARKPSLGRDFCRPLVLLMIVIYFFHNCLVYGCMTFFTSTLHNEELKFKAWQYGILFALPYALTAVLMMLVSRHSDKVNERRMHVAVTYFISGLCLIISMTLHTHFKMSPLAHFWWAYAFLCLSIPGPSVVLGPFWSIASEALPVSTRGAVMGLINACGNLGGYYGPSIVGLLKHKTGSLEIPFDALGIGILIAAGLSLLLPKAAPIQRT